MPLPRRAATVRTQLAGRRQIHLAAGAQQQPEPAGLQQLLQPEPEVNDHPAPTPQPPTPQGEPRYRAPMVRLRVLPDEDHVPDNYGDAPDELGITPAVYQALERHLPRDLVGAPREVKSYFMRSILQNYVSSPSQRIRTQNHREYRLRKSVLYPDVGVNTLDSHHSYVVEYGEADDARGPSGAPPALPRMTLWVSSNAGEDQEHFVHPNVPGQVVLHHGSHRHGVFPVTSGERINMVMWCKSSMFREMKKFMTDFSGFCGECQFEWTERQMQHLQELMARISISGENEAP
ncbi:hypothetical protein E2562_000701 [Oryza meyeriana var. granulata]|uniref:Fe2OG dioxygenase domain-containing protein n=1 Tax=Oryza meyeriana var. granulata TaxID=110450 RepID=A0A6G1DV59_9ORYZ|nr:hypothetical protein E2562_000701 [Oryza meyeriana var. granulata]